MNRSFDGKTALITGAGKKSGIGYGIARRLAADGASLVLTDLGDDADRNVPVLLGSVAEMEAIAEELRAEHGAEVLVQPMDVSSPESVAATVAAVRERFGRLDVLFNNAGAAIGAPKAIHEYDEDAWIRTVDVNLHGVFRVSQAAVALMDGGPGAIVNLASKAGKSPAPLNGAYAASKAAVIMLTKVMAIELAEAGVRVNAVCPGLIATDLQRGNVALKAVVMGTTVEEAEQRLLDAVPLKRMGTIDEVAELCAFLASDRASYITGQAINIGGGLFTEL